MAQKAPSPDKKDKGRNKGAAPSGKGKISEDIHLIRNAALVFAAMLILAGGLVYFSNDFMGRKQGQLNTALQQRDDAQQKLSRAREEEQEIRKYLVLYQRLVDLKIVGDETRLEWIEALQQASQKHKLAAISYEIFPQQTVPLDAALSAGEMELRATPAKLKFDLLHEGDLFTLLSALKQAAHDFFSAQNCTIERRQLSASGEGAVKSLENRLTANCTIHWLTIGTRQMPPGEENADSPPPPEP